MKAKDAPSKVETVKRESAGLRGALAAGLADAAPAFDDDGYQLLKFHGIYQGYDRDSATERKQQGLDKEHQFMVRVRIPGGRLTARQYLALDDLADRAGNGSLRVTTRQSIQFHGTLKRDLKETVAAVNEALLTTLAACGDVVRTVTTVAAPIRDAAHRRLEADARALSQHLLPKSDAYHEIWLDGARVAGEDEETLYGDAYLPRKFKIGLAFPEDNSVDVLTNDLAIIALWENGALLGYNFALGGGLGVTHNNPKTFPRLASLVAFVAADDLVAAATAVVTLHRDHGDRSDRRHARLKYLIAERGDAWAKAELERTLGKALGAPRAMPPFRVRDHLGWHEQGDGKLYLGLPISSGRIVDDDRSKLRTALREIVVQYGVDPILMPSQDIVLSEIAPKDRKAIEKTLRAYGVRFGSDLRPVERWALACPALPTCGLALTEAERVSDLLIAEIVERMERWGVERERMSIRITGCPNGCARPYSGDIGIVGRIPGFYSIYVGGDFEGTRLNEVVAERIRLGEVADVLDPLFALFAASRRDGEGFGDFCHRVGVARLKDVLVATRAEPGAAAD
jgi:sulfite reductase (ferredoxin)